MNMQPHYTDATITVHHGDALEVLRGLPDASVDSVVCDPPYGLANTDPAHVAETITRWVNGERDYLPGGSGFMGKAWDAFVPPVAVWDECLRVLKPGGHVLTFAGSRTVDLMTLGLRLAGFDIRDSIAWLYGSGFPKSLDVSKAINATQRHGGANSVSLRRAAMGEDYRPSGAQGNRDGYGGAARAGDGYFSGDLTEDAERWQGWGTALKPSHEPVVCARKPFNAVPLGEEVDRLHHLIGGLLWLSLSPAKRAELTSPSSPAGQHEAPCVSALVSAALNTSPDASDETATFSSPALASTSSNIASSWSATLGALSARTRTSTTSTASSTTTALRTLNSLLGPITSQTTMPRCGCLVDGPSSPAPSAASSSSDEWAKWLHTLSASVPETATEGIALVVASALASIADELSGDQAAASSADPTATTGAAASRSAFEPIIVARKPLAGTVAANVTEYGTGALNIDGCRLGGGQDYRDKCASVVGLDSNRNGDAYGEWTGARQDSAHAAGRWPANVVLDESQAEALDQMSGESISTVGIPGKIGGYYLGGCSTVDELRALAERGEGTPDGRNTAAATLARYERSERRERGHNDSGGASRFFYVAREDNEPCPSTNTANTAASPSSHPSEPAGSAPSDAATSAHLDTDRPTGSPSTNGTPSASRPSGAPSTPTTSSTASESSPDSPHARPTPTGNPANSVGPNPPTDTTTTTTSPSTSDGSADLTTSSSTPPSVPGVPLDGLGSRFTYVAKAGQDERVRVNGTAHPTVKPLSLMRWLVRLVTPPGGTVLEPFAGSGTTAEACLLEGFKCIAVEREAEYLPLIMQRIHRRRDPVEAVRGAGEDGGLFDLLDGEGIT